MLKPDQRPLLPQWRTEGSCDRRAGPQVNHLRAVRLSRPPDRSNQVPHVPGRRDRRVPTRRVSFD